MTVSGVTDKAHCPCLASASPPYSWVLPASPGGFPTRWIAGSRCHADRSAEPGHPFSPFMVTLLQHCSAMSRNNQAVPCYGRLPSDSKDRMQQPTRASLGTRASELRMCFLQIWSGLFPLLRCPQRQPGSQAWDNDLSLLLAFFFKGVGLALYPG